MTELLLIDVPEACGFGRGPMCCAFLALGAGSSAGGACGRTIPTVYAAINERLVLGTMAAKYDPVGKPFPDCQPFKEET